MKKKKKKRGSYKPKDEKITNTPTKSELDQDLDEMFDHLETAEGNI